MFVIPFVNTNFHHFNQNQEVDVVKRVEFCQEDRIKYLEGDQGDKGVNDSVD